MKTHGMSNTKLYRRWNSMKQRCLNSKNSEYHNYGGRDITVCKEWMDFDAFAKWALNGGYSEGLTLERMDVNGDYTPENCTWATLKEQMNNKRNNIVVDTEIGRMTLSEYCEKTGIRYNTAQMRHYRQDKLSLPVNYRHRPVVRDDGKVYQTITDAARDNDVIDTRIKAVCKGERKRTAGHSFYFLTRAEAEAAMQEGGQDDE